MGYKIHHQSLQPLILAAVVGRYLAFGGDDQPEDQIRSAPFPTLPSSFTQDAAA